jgi:flagellar basal-body rod modification protein FlgD
MSSIGTVLPNAGVNTASADATNSTASNAQAGTNNLGNVNTFLNLLVAQLQNQDPTNPVDGTTFVTQLAEFNNVQQSIGIRQDLDAISEKYLGATTPPSQASTTSNSSTQQP